MRKRSSETGEGIIIEKKDSKKEKVGRDDEEGKKVERKNSSEEG